MPKPNVLVLATAEQPEFQMLADIPHTFCNDVAACADAAGDCTAILQWNGTRDMLRAALAAGNNVRWIHSRSAGLDNMLFPELIENPVILTNGRGVFSASLGEFVLAAILYFAKDFRRMIRNQSEGRWEPFDVEEISGQIVGIVGYGDIGRAVATRVRAMGMRVLALRRTIPANPDDRDPVIERYLPAKHLKEMLAHCDYVVATAPLTEETRHMISDAEFAVMKTTAVIINVGRGPVIDEKAMIQALTSHRIKGAGLDVFENEPLPPGHPLFSLENVLLSPHCADHTADWHQQAMRVFLEQYARFEKGETLQNIVNKRLGY